MLTANWPQYGFTLFYLSANYYSPIGHIVAITVHEVGLLWDTDPCLLDSLSGKAGDPVLIEIS